MEKREKTGGRKKNSPNKTTTEIKNLFIQVLGANMDTIQKDLDEMPGKDRLAALLKISSMVIPKPIEPVNIDEASKSNFEMIQRLFSNKND